MEKHILTKESLLNAQVCSSGSCDEALEWLRTTNPAGTSNNWSKCEEKELSPIKCATYPERTHYQFEC